MSIKNNGNLSIELIKSSIINPNLACFGLKNIRLLLFLRKYKKTTTNYIIYLLFPYPLPPKRSNKLQSFFQLREGWKRHPLLFSLKRKDTAYSPTRTEFTEEGARPKANLKQNESEF
jgi:hypothetical protein